MIALIAEKPSVAKDIARIIGATGRNDGYLSGNGYMVTWAFGHLIQLAMPEAYGVANFRRESLPILPPDFQLIPRQVKAEKGYKADPGVLKQLKVIKEVFDQCDRIIVATDAGREGELIFRYIFHYLNCRKPFKDERAVYELVAGRMLEAFSGKCVKDVTTALLSGGDTDFTVKGSVMKVTGWRAVFGEQETGGDEEAASLPPLQEGEYLPLSGVDLLEKQTKPKPLHTESSLLAAMENAGRELEDAELKASLKDAGIGTPATRAAIIETLFARQYIVREKKNLVPTDKGLAVYGIVRDKKIADVEMTGMWETALAKIEAGSMDADTFRKGIEVYATQITAELLSVQLSVATGETCPCPKCGSGRILFYPKVAKCSNVDCTLTIFRNKCDKQLSDKQIVELVTKRKTGLIKGFKGKNGKAFDASLVLDEQFNVGFSFPEKKAKPKK